MQSKNPLINLLKHAWHYSFERKKWFVFVAVFSVIGNVVWLMQFIVVGRIFNEIQFSSQEDPVRYVALSMLLLIIINILGWFFHGFSRVVENRNAFLIRKNYRQAMFERVMELPTSWHKDHHSGDTIDKINKASDKLYEFSSELFFIIQNVIGLIASIIILTFYDVRPVVVVFFSSVVAILVIMKFDRKLLQNYKAINKAENHISAGIYDYISNYLTIISLRLKNQAAKEMDLRSMSPFEVQMQSNKLNEIKWFLSSLIISLMTAGVLLWNAYNSYRTTGVILIGTLFILYQYLDKIGNAFYTFAWKYSDTVRQNAAVVAAEIINQEYEKLHLDQKRLLPADWKLLAINNLSFVYQNDAESGSQRHTLRSVDIRIGRKQKIALIGVSGSGKSTILSLLRGLHLADSAEVACDGKVLPAGLRHIHDHCSLIPQEPEIFNNTIEYNITLGVHVPRKRIDRVIALARLKGLISRLDKGLKTSVLEKGVSLSGGEKQRLALARGLLAAQESEILLLDEPTSSVDVENEHQIYQNIFKAFPGKAIISAVHSLHLLPYFDHVYMFKEGELVAEGDFKTILKDENFNQLWQKYDAEITKDKE
jgi:ABC-type multidrug transport system fused ATPase/permease subunit